MDLSISILHERLSRTFAATLEGVSYETIPLNNPELYLEGTNQLLSGHCYVSSLKHLPSRPRIEKGVLIICIGEGTRLNYYRSHASVIVVDEKANLYHVHQEVCQIFNLFSTWQSNLLSLLTSAGNARELLECSLPIFERPLYLINNSFDCIAIANPGDSKLRVEDGKSINIEDFKTFMHDTSIEVDRHGAFFPPISGINVLCVNIFGKSNEYIGCLFITEDNKPFVAGEEALATFLGRIIQRSEESNPSLAQVSRTSIRTIIELLLDERPLSHSQTLLLDRQNGTLSYRFISVHYAQRFASMPANYICSIFVSLLPGSILFEHDNSVVGIAPLGSSATLNQELLSFIDDMQLLVGISNSFTDLYDIRNHYMQSEAAIENAQLIAASGNVFDFNDFAIVEMIASILERFPLSAYYPPGFEALIEHDRNANVSYLESLEACLDENMSFSKAADRLFVHRSTLIERIERIEKELECDLKDPIQRLRLQIIIKALKMERRA